MSCMVLGKQTIALLLEIMMENTQLTYLILWCYLLWQPEENKCFLVNSGFHASLSVLNHVPAMFAYLPEKFSGWKAKLQNTWGQELRQLLLHFHYRNSDVRGKTSLFLTRVWGLQVQRVKEFHLQGDGIYMWLHIVLKFVIYCCCFIWLRNGRMGRNAKKHHLEVFAVVVEYW